MSTPLKHLVYLQLSGPYAGPYGESYANNLLKKYGMPDSGLGWNQLTESAWTNKRDDMIKFLKAKFETFHVEITTNQSTWNSWTDSRKIGKVIFLPVKNDFTNVSSFYYKLKQYLLVNQGYFNPLRAISFQSLKTGFVFLADHDPYDNNSALEVAYAEHNAASIISQFLRLQTINMGYSGSQSYSRRRWTTLQRKSIIPYSEALYNQWYIGGGVGQDATKVIGLRTGYVKTPTPTNIANTAGSNLILTKQRLVGRADTQSFSLLPINAEHDGLSPGFVRSRDYVINGMIGFPGNCDYLKILLEAGTYKLMHVHLDHSMLDVKISLLNPECEIPKNKNNLNSSSIKSECANKISEYPIRGFKTHECFGLNKDIESEYFLESNPQDTAAAIEFTVTKRTFVYLKIEGAGSYNSGTNKADIGKYAIGFVNVDKRKISNDYTYPPCYLHWSRDQAPAENKLSRIKIIQNGEIKEVAFYLQEKEDSTPTGAIETLSRKFNTVVNGKLLDRSHADGIWYIVNQKERDLNYSFPEGHRQDQRFYLFTPTILAGSGATVYTEFIAGGVYDEGQDKAFEPGSGSSGQFIKNLSDASSGNYSQTPSPTEGVPFTPGPSPTPTPTPTPTSTPEPSQTPLPDCSSKGFSNDPLSCDAPCFSQVIYVSDIYRDCYRCVRDDDSVNFPFGRRC